MSDSPQDKYIAINKYTSGNDLWVVMQRRDAQDPTNADRYIRLYRLQRTKDGWGYSDYAEADCPYVFSCPLIFLDITFHQNTDWRKGVREYWKARKEAMTTRRKSSPS
jgi:hypothetical protein